MDNMDKSYFIYKAKARNKIKENFKKIEKCERKINRIKAGKYSSGNVEFDKPYDEQAIRFLKEMIEEAQIKINKKKNLICHG